MAAYAAVMIYGSERSQFGGSEMVPLAATFHDIALCAGRPEIQPGRPCTEADLSKLVQGLAASQELGVPTWVEPNLLAAGAGRMVWYSEPRMQPMFFKVSAVSDDTFEGRAVVPIPGLVWMVWQHSLYLWAYKGTGRPQRAQALFQAPFFNVWSQGKVCVGNATFPRGSDAMQTGKWEAGFFGSHFTHPNFTQKDRLVHGIDPKVFWAAMVQAPPAAFPEERLVPLRLQVQSLVDPGLAALLGESPRATGEF